MKRQGYLVDFFCGCFLNKGNEKIVLSPETLGGVAMLGAELDLDVYPYLEECEEEESE